MRDLTRLLNPKTIAFIGGRDAAEAVRVCHRFRFTGEIWPVSASRTEMDGLKAYNSLDDLPDVPSDLYMSRGHNQNHSFIIPSMDLVVVRQGNDNRRVVDGEPFETALIQKVVAAISS